MFRGCIAYIILFFCLPVAAQTSDTLTLQACYDSLYSNYPIARQKLIFEKIRELKIRNVKNNYLPAVNLGAQSTVQSDVPHIEIKSSSPATTNIIENLDIPLPPLWQNKIYFEITQSVYDGGLTRAQKKLENTSSDIDQKKLEVELIKLHEQINYLFFNLYYIKVNEHALHILRSDLDNKRKNSLAAVNSGVMLESNLNLIEAEILKLDQQISEVKTNKENLINSLKELIKRDISGSTELYIPDLDINAENLNGIRPEIELLTLNKTLLDNSIMLLKASRRPKFFFFGQAGYGRPGLNMLSSTYDPYAYFGVKFNYTILDWRNNARNIKINEYRKDIISSQIETYELNQRIALKNTLNNIGKIMDILSKDNKIIELRKNVSRVSSQKFENGSLSARDYLVEKNAELNAEINKNYHQLLLLNAKLDYLTISGKLK